MIRQERRRARAAARKRSGNASPELSDHLETGRRGETLAYWFLRSRGYVMVARNLRLRRDAGELDMAGWDGNVLAFVEVKTRTSREAGLPEEAVGNDQRRRIARAAQLFVRRLGRKDIMYRFDIVSVFSDLENGYQLKLFKDAFRTSSVSRS
ncbi:MAG: YraN family protein [Acidobacteriota bacterium]|nr:YraN family protein [Acidobacteriota bacterium]